MRIPLSFAACLLAGSLSAADFELAGTFSGFVFDRNAHAVRAVVGVPGAAYLGAEVAGGVDLAAVSPDGARALLVRGGELFLLRLASGELVSLGSIESASRIAWSADSKVAAVAGSRVAAWGSLDAEPAALAVADFSDPVELLAVSADGAVAVAGSFGVRTIGADAVQSIPGLDSATALAVRGSDLYAAAAGRVFVIHNFASAPEAALAAGDALQMDEIAAISLTPDGETLLVAGGDQIAAVRLASAEIAGRVKTDSAAAQIDRMGGSLYRLDSGDGAVAVLDTRAMSVFFIPAAAADLAVEVDQ